MDSDRRPRSWPTSQWWRGRSEVSPSHHHWAILKELRLLEISTFTLTWSWSWYISYFEFKLKYYFIKQMQRTILIHPESMKHSIQIATLHEQQFDTIVTIHNFIELWGGWVVQSIIISNCPEPYWSTFLPSIWSTCHVRTKQRSLPNFKEAFQF